jgi:GAF domain-containing protein
MTEARVGRASDVPPDLQKERETFVRTFLKRGVEITEELIRENQELRGDLVQLQDENARLRAQIASEDAIRDLLATVETLERERRSLLSRSEELQRTTATHEDRYAQMEQEINDLASLYVASNQLNGTLALRRVVRHIQELLEQLIGARAFVIYVMQKNSMLVPIASQGLDEASLGPLAVGEGRVGEAVLTGLVFIEPDASVDGTLERPLVAIPLITDGHAVGAIALVQLFEQKRGWAPVDEELFKLLGAQASTALIAASLYPVDEGPLPALADIQEKLRNPRPTPAQT